MKPWRIFIIALALLALLLLSYQAAVPASAQSRTIPITSLLNEEGTINTATGASGTLDLRGWNVTLDSKRGPILSPQAHAAPLTGSWSALSHGGLDASVHALAVNGTDVYVGGTFSQTNDGAVKNLNHIARFNTSTNTWSALPHGGLNYTVAAFAVIGTDLYVGGLFNQTADSAVNLNYIAKFDGVNWSALSNNGLSAEVNAFAVSGTDLYVGGGFYSTSDGTVISQGIAKYSSGGWSALPHNGLNGTAFALAVDGNGNLYVGGVFSQTSDAVVKNLNNIAIFTGGAWVPLSNNGLDNEVQALAVNGTDLYVGGSFTQTADGVVTNLKNIARFNTSTNAWSALPHGGLNFSVDALVVSGTDVYVGGYFYQTADSAMNLNYIAKFDGTNWSVLPNNGLNVDVFAMALNGTHIYLGGGFTQTKDAAVKNLNYIAKLSLVCKTAPAKPLLKAPANSATTTKTRPTLKWNSANCADTYNVTVKDAATGKNVDSAKGLTTLRYQTKALTKGKLYKWFVKACDSIGCTKSSTWTFKVQ